MENLPTQRLLDIPPKMVLEIAYGVEDPPIVAERYGFSRAEFDQLKAYEPFKRQVDEKVAELKASGYTFRMKSAMCAEDLIDDVFDSAKEQGASFHTKLEALKFFAKSAGLESPVKQQMESGPGFSITINLGNGNEVKIGGNSGPRTIEHEASSGEMEPLPVYVPEGLFVEIEDSE